MKTAKIKLQLQKNYSLEEIKQLVDKGAKFIIFQYSISVFLAVILRRLSPAIFIIPGDPINKYKRKYNLLSSIFGWWGLPWGPIRTIQCLRFNNNGGIDYTDEIMLNITARGIVEREVEMLKTNLLFSKPDKWDIKSFKKALLRDFERDYSIKKIIVALFINVEEGTRPYFTIGIRTDKDLNSYIPRLKESLLKQFFKSTYFEFIDLNRDDKISRLLEVQGEIIIERGGI